MRILTGALVTVSALALAGAAPAGKPAPAKKPPPVQKAALEAVARGVAQGRLDPASGARYRADVLRAAALARRLPAPRAAPIADSLRLVGTLSGRLTGPRAVTAFGQLRVTTDWFAHRSPPAAQTETTDADGVVHRYFPGSGFVFHPLGAAIALNAAVASKDAARTERLASALAARTVPQAGGGLGLEYLFPYAGGRPPWLSGMAQAVAAQAFAGAARLVPPESSALTAQARGAYQAIPGRLVTRIASGPWIKLYSFNGWVVLNAHLQGILSLSAYASATEDTEAASLVEQLKTAAVAELARFDTGYWTLYSLPRNLSPLSYQSYVADMLDLLARRDARFADAARRVPEYERQPPAFRLADAGVGAVRFWLSKPASVRVSAAGRARYLALGDGWHTVSLGLPKRPGSYPVTVSARDWAGNAASVKALPLVRVVPLVPEKLPASGEPQPPAREKGSAAPVAAGPSFAVGAGVDNPAQARLALRQGYGALRMSVVWPAGAELPEPSVLTALRSLPAANRLVVELVADPLPADDASRTALAAYAAALVGQLPGLTDLMLGQPPSAATAAAYAPALGAVHDAVEARRADVAVTAALDGAAGPRATLAALARAFRASGRTAPYVEQLAFRPAASPASGAWGVDGLSELTKALSAAFGTTSPVPVLVDGLAVQTRIPAGKAGAYAPADGPRPVTVSEDTQAAAYERSVGLARCRPDVSGVLLRRLVDAAAPGEQSGVFYADSTPKASAASTARAASTAQRGTPVCPGVGIAVAAETLEFPDRLERTGAPTVRLACTRDCLYLVTLERPDGKPVLARRGALDGGAPTSIRLPSAPLPAGAYRFAVRLVGQVNPGPVQVVSSSALGVG